MKDNFGKKNLLEKRIRKMSEDLQTNLTFKTRQLKEESSICIKELQENLSIIWHCKKNICIFCFAQRAARS